MQNTLQKHTEDIRKIQEDNGAFQYETRTVMNRIFTELNKIHSSMEKSQGKLPAQVEVNPRENVHAITLRNGKELQSPPLKHVEDKTNQMEKEEELKPIKKA